jgi:hypothetical protein
LFIPSLSSLFYCLWARPRAYQIVEHLKGSSIGLGSCFKSSHYTILERLAMDKHSSFLWTFVNYLQSINGYYCWLNILLLNQGILKGKVSLYCWPPIWQVWNQLYDNWQILFLFAKLTNPKRSNRRLTVQWYFPPLVFPASTFQLPLLVYTKTNFRQVCILPT